MIRGLVFDMGGVLVRFSHEQMCAQLGAVCGKTAAEIRARLMDAGWLWDLERGRLTPDEFCHRLASFADRPLDETAVSVAASDIFTPMESMAELLDGLRRSGYRLVLLSNTSVWHFEWIWRRFDLLQRFDAHVLSYQVGALKPDPAMYAAAVDAVQCPTGEAFYTDDIPAYVDAGRQAGLQAAVFTTPSALRETLRAAGCHWE
jgi:putative hydrolase of the HAD superfamily